jgi:hypothetical protein
MWNSLQGVLRGSIIGLTVRVINCCCRKFRLDARMKLFIHNEF